MRQGDSALRTASPAGSVKPYDVQQVINKHSNSHTVILGCTFLKNDLSEVLFFLQATLLCSLMARNIILQIMGHLSEK